MPTVTPPDHRVYYRSVYWNDFPRVLEHICRRCTGDARTWWADDFKSRYCASAPFQRGLFLNCGNGWVERDFIDRGIVRTAIGFDYSADLLKAAKDARQDRRITYFRADVNNLELGEDAFDLVVNVGGLHHVQYINRLSVILCRSITPDGVMVSYDYVGPARNQYSRRHWRLVQRANRNLPPAIRRDQLRRPHLFTMLQDDPTEAIHSDLTLETLGRYFDLVERHDVGGGIAYEILTHNLKARELREDEVRHHLDRLLAMDEELTAAGRVPTLFSYFVARPRKATLSGPGVRAHQEAEDLRERRAARFQGTYRLRDWGKLAALEAAGRLLRLAPAPLRRLGGHRARRLLKLGEGD